MLGEHVEILSGYAFKSKEFNDKGLGIPVVRIRDVGKEKSETFYDGEYSDDYLLDNGDLLIGMDGDFRLAEWQGGKALLNQRVCKITSKGSTLDRGYMYYMLPRELKRIEDTTSFATVKHLSVKKIKEIEIPLPPLPQQKKIAAILDAADAYRQLTKALIAKYEELTQSLFLDMFGDPVKNNKNFEFPKLGELCKVSQGMQIAIKHRFNEPGPDRLTYLTVAYLNGKKDAEYIENPRKSVVCSKEDVLMTRTGNTGQVVYDVEGVFHNNFFKIEWDKSKVERNYFIAFLSHSKIRQELLKRASTTTIPDLNHGQFYDLNIILPKLSEQKRFVNTLYTIEEQKAQAQESLAKAEDLFNSLLQKAFKGDLT